MSRLDGVKFNVHATFQDESPERLKLISQKTSLPVHLMLFNLDGNMNIAMSVRSAAVLGCSDVWIIGKRKYDARPEVGAKNYINVHKLENIDPTTFFEENNLQPFLIEQGGSPLEETNFKHNFDKQVCFVMGSESHGLPDELLNIKNIPRVTISQYGLIRSLNVSIAASIVMYEYLKQWRTYRKTVI